MNAVKTPSEADVRAMLRAAGLRATRPRLVVARRLFAAGPRHVRPETLRDEARAMGEPIALSTIYNVVRAFVAAGLARMTPPTDTGARLVDARAEPHGHMLNEATGALVDLPAGAVRVEVVALPEGMELVDVEVVARARPRKNLGKNLE